MARRSLQDWLTLQQSTHPRAIDLGLQRVRDVATRMGLLPFPAAVITVAGTNGKGSTVAFLEALLCAAEVSCGAFTSPHLQRYNERVRVAGAEVTDAELVLAFEVIDEARGNHTLTYFEYGALAALQVFRARAVAVAVLEVGLGGRLDAVNIVDADVAVITSIGMDHRDWLGDTLAQIGREKAGILRGGRAAILGPDMPDSVLQHARNIGARVCAAQRDFRWLVHASGEWDFQGAQWQLSGLPAPGLAGLHQYANAAGALAALEQLPAMLLDAARVARGLQTVSLPGRLQRLDPACHAGVEWIFDVAHNAPAAAVLAASLAVLPSAGTTFAVVGILADKDVAAIVQTMAAQVDVWIACSIHEPRGLSATQLVERSALLGTALRSDSVGAGLERARALAQPGDRVVVFGSFLTVGPALHSAGLY